eukprot:4781854-Prymnesium_polylepis.2
MASLLPHGSNTLSPVTDCRREVANPVPGRARRHGGLDRTFAAAAILGGSPREGQNRRQMVDWELIGNCMGL